MSEQSETLNGTRKDEAREDGAREDGARIASPESAAPAGGARTVKDAVKDNAKDGAKKGVNEDGDRPVPRIESFRDLRRHIREDYEVNNQSRRKWTPATPGFQAIFVYRVGVWCNSIRPRVLRVPVRILYRLANLFVRNVYGIELSATTYVGRRLRIVHQHGIVVHQTAVIGDDCLLRQGCTIGAAGEGPRPPVLGNRVKVGVGAVIAGPVTIGDDVNIGPNAVVMTNVAPGSIVASPVAGDDPPAQAPQRLNPGARGGRAASPSRPCH